MASSTDFMKGEGCNDGRRSAPRLALSLPGKFMSTLGEQDCILIDLSRDGAQIVIKEALPVGKDGFLRCGPLDHFVTVVRKGNGRNALSFEIPVSDIFVKKMRDFQANFAELELAELHEIARSWSEGALTSHW